MGPPAICMKGAPGTNTTAGAVNIKEQSAGLERINTHGLQPLDTMGQVGPVTEGRAGRNESDCSGAPSHCPVLRP